MQPILLIACGGALGAVARHLSVSAAARLLGPGFPYGVPVVNVIGSFLMGLAAALIIERVGAGRASLFLVTGVLGGFTTFSAFSLDAISLIEQGRLAAASWYVLGSVLLSVGALALGLYLGRGLA